MFVQNNNLTNKLGAVGISFGFRETGERGEGPNFPTLKPTG